MEEVEPGTCHKCGAALATGQRFCGQCGSERPAGGAAPAADGLAWEVDVGLLTNPLILRQFATLLGVTGLIMFGLLALLFAVQGEWESIPYALLATLVGVGVVAVLMLVVIVLFLGNRFHARFGVSEKGVSYATVDRRAKAAGRLAVILGVLGRSPGTAGAGMLTVAREEEAVGWRAIASAVYHPRSRTIDLRNGWRTVAFLACTPANYEAVAAYVRAHVRPRAASAAGRSPLPRLLLRTLLVIVASLPVFLLPYPFELDLLAPLVMLCFALATVWLVHLFGWVVIAAALWIVGEIVLIALSVHESMFASLGRYRTYEILNGDDWLALALAAAGLAYLVAFSWRAARGRIPSALSQDYAEGDE